jgi:hypothetical protein
MLSVQTVPANPCTDLINRNFQPGFGCDPKQGTPGVIVGSYHQIICSAEK